MPNDSPEERAGRVEQVLETGDLEKAMDALVKEIQDLGPEERAAVLKSLEEQNKQANAGNWTLPDVTLSEETTLPMGFGDKTGNVNVTMTHSGSERAVSFLEFISGSAKEKEPYSKITSTFKEMNGDSQGDKK